MKIVRTAAFGVPHQGGRGHSPAGQRLPDSAEIAIFFVVDQGNLPVGRHILILLGHNNLINPQ